jgi:hypothetical protein
MSDLFNAFPYIGALIAGLLSFLSPCVLPLMPSYLSYITGVSFEDLQNATDKKRIQMLTLTNSLFFYTGIFFGLYLPRRIFISCRSAICKLPRMDKDYWRCGDNFLRPFCSRFLPGEYSAAGKKVSFTRQTHWVFWLCCCRNCLCNWLDTMYRSDTWIHIALRKRPGINPLWCKTALYVFAGAGNSFPVRFVSLQFFSQLFEKGTEVYESDHACQWHTACGIRHTASDK